MTGEDRKLICPISYDDPFNIWSLIEGGIVSCSPLRDVTWRSQFSSSMITIANLPIKFLPSNSSLFNNADHPFRWFLAPYVHIYIVVSETLENYKSQKPTIKKWIASIKQTQSQRSSWLLLFVPTARQSIEVLCSIDILKSRCKNHDHQLPNYILSFCDDFYDLNVADAPENI